MDDNPSDTGTFEDFLRFGGWNRVNNRSATQLIEMDFLKQISGIMLFTKFGACDSVTQQVTIGVLRNFCSLATLYGDC